MTNYAKPKTEKTCACGKVFYTAYKHKIHCNRRCQNDLNSNIFGWNSAKRDIKYRMTYGITLNDYNKLFEEQAGCCKICKRHQTEFKKRLNVDHKHDTGEVRGLLCHNCNLALGRLGDDPEIIKAALEYVS